MTDWPRVALETIAVDVQPGFACQPTDDPSGIPQLRTNNVSPLGGIDLSETKRVPANDAWIKRYSLKPGDVLFNNTNSPALVGKTALFDEDGLFLFSNHMTRIRLAIDIAEPAYVAHYLHWVWKRGILRGLITQWVNQAAINRRQLSAIQLPLPPLAEQRRIVEILDHTNRLRRLRADADAKSNRILPALLVRVLGNPANWGSEPPARPLGDFIDPVSGATPSKTTERFWSGEVPWVSPKDMKVDFLSDSQDHVSQVAVDETHLNVIEQGSTLIVVRGMILARDVPVAINRNPVTINQDMKALVPKTTEITGAYIWATLHLARRKLQTLVRTAGHGTRKLDTPDLMQFPIPAPDTDRLKQVASIVEHHRLAVEQRQKSKKMLDRVFAVALHKAFDGSLTTSWRNRHREDLGREMKRLERTALDAAP